MTFQNNLPDDNIWRLLEITDSRFKFCAQMHNISTSISSIELKARWYHITDLQVRSISKSTAGLTRFDEMRLISYSSLSPKQWAEIIRIKKGRRGVAITYGSHLWRIMVLLYRISVCEAYLSFSLSKGRWCAIQVKCLGLLQDWSKIVKWITFLLFSNWDDILVIMPRAAMKDNLLRTWDTPFRSILKRLMLQFPLLIADSIPIVMRSGLIHFEISNGCVRFARPKALSACDHISMSQRYNFLQHLSLSFLCTIHTKAEFLRRKLFQIIPHVPSVSNLRVQMSSVFSCKIQNLVFWFSWQSHD